MTAAGKDTFRPNDWDHFIGQNNLKERLQVHIQAAREQQRPMDHVLLAGPPGFGKSSLAELIATDLTDPLHTLTMPIDRNTLIYTLANFEGGVLFLDEIHAMTKRDQEVLLPVLEDGVVIDKHGFRSVVPWLTIVAATTERDKLIAPLYDRFAVKPDFVPYTEDELSQIVMGMAQKIGLELPEQDARVFGRASGGVPRNARQFITATRDLASVQDKPPTAQEVLALCQVDEDGLSMQHLQYLEVLHSQRGVAAERTIEMILRVPKPVIRDLERLLLANGYMQYSPSGRRLTPKGMSKVGGAAPYSRRRAS